MEPPNKGHVGDNIVLSFVERLSSFRGSQCVEPIYIGKVIFGTSSSVLCREV